MIRLRPNAVAASFAAAIAIQAHAGFPISVSVNASDTAISSASKIYSSLLAGANVPWTGHGEAIYANDTFEPRLLSLAMGLGGQPLRYPGGELADSYIWSRGIGALTSRPAHSYYPSANSNNQSQQRIDFGTDEFLTYCLQLNCTPIFQINMHSSASGKGAAASDTDIAEAAKTWQTYVNNYLTNAGRTDLTVYWELGNEPYLKDKYFTGGEANDLYIDDARYLARVKKVIDTMAAGTKFILPFALDTWNGSIYDAANTTNNPASVTGDHISIPSSGKVGYSNTLLSGLATTHLTKIAALGLHYYMPIIGNAASTSVPSDSQLFWATMAGAKSAIGTNLPAIRNLWAQYSTTTPKFAITEYNALYTTNSPELRQNKFIASKTGAIYTSDLLGMLSKESDVILGTYWSMSRNGYFGALSFADVAPSYPTFVRPSYYSLNWFRQGFGSSANKLLSPTVTVQTTASHSATIGFSIATSSLPLAAATASVNPSTKVLTVQMINREISATGDITLNLTGGAASSASLKYMSQNASAQFATSETSSIVTSTTGTVDIANSQTIKFSLPAYNVGILTIQLQ